MKVYITGLEDDSHNEGAISASGIGLARAIRCAYPDARLVGVSYAQPTTHVQWPDFDEQWHAGPWRTIDFAHHQQKIEECLTDGGWWISGLPHETQWLAQALSGHERVLVPPMAALESIQVPLATMATELGLSAPASMLATAPDWDLNTFGRRHGWRVWLRTADDSGQRIHNWQAFHQARLALGESAFADAGFLQEHIEGTPESLAFAAYQGELVACALCVAAETTRAGEPWASRVEEAPAPMVAALTRTLRALRWTGGGSLSLVRDEAERRWALGWRAGFPAWIFGAALAGENLPAQLLERATGEVAMPQSGVSQEFVRVVIEVPLLRSRDEQPTGPGVITTDDAQPVKNAGGASSPGVIGSGVIGAATPQIPDEIVADVASAARDLNETPTWLFLPEAAHGAFLQAEDLMRRFSTPDLRVRVAYSVKTNPERRLLELAHTSGLLAETISQSEVQKAISCGFPAGRIVLNGPAKQWPEPNATREPLHAVFCDSLEELRAAIAAGASGEPGIYQAEILGVRLRASQFTSRFGIPVDTPESTEIVGALVRQLPVASRFGVHFHMGSNALGLDQWWRLFSQMLASAQAIEMASGRRVTCLDLGGGWFPDDWREELSPRFEERIRQRVTSALPHVRELFLEPGRALAQSSMALAVRVLEARRGADGRIDDVVVDGSIAELAYHNYTIFPHRILWRDPIEQRWRPVGRGRARILGRLCMEKDILADLIDAPDSLAAGDLLVFCDAGAYDRSMSYSFGLG